MPKRKQKSSIPAHSSSSYDGPSDNYSPPKVRAVRYTSEQKERLNYLVFGLGCCKWTVNSERLIGDVWLHIPEERGGGMGIGLTPRQIIQYCKTRGYGVLDGEERFQDFFRWMMNQPEYANTLPAPDPNKTQGHVDTPPFTRSLDSGPNVPALPVAGLSSTPMEYFQSQAELELVNILAPLSTGYFYLPPPPGSFPGPLWPIEAPSPLPMTVMQEIAERAISSQTSASSEEDSEKFFQMIDDILPDRPKDSAIPPHNSSPTATIYTLIPGPPVPVSHAARALTPVATASLAVLSAADPSLMSPRSKVASRMPQESKALLLALSPESTTASFTPQAGAASRGNTHIFRLKVRYTADGVEYLASTPGLVSIDVKWEDLLANIIEYEIIVKQKDAMGFLMKSPGFIGVSVS
ncbi:hypothetical protein EV426DRAFT_702209 [Tirmania nivea]|nr:hypothetical protein EV426DRAFT_702209 [Tirmania nivea]